MSETKEFEGAKEVQVAAVSFSKVGDLIVGYFTGNQKKIITQNGPSTIYEIKGLFGEFHLADTITDANGNKVTTVKEPGIQVEAGTFYTLFGGKQAIDDLFRQSKFGQKVGIKFEEAVPSKVKGHSAFKKFKVVQWDETDPELKTDEMIIVE